MECDIVTGYGVAFCCCFILLLLHSAVVKLNIRPRSFTTFPSVATIAVQHFHESICPPGFQLVGVIGSNATHTPARQKQARTATLNTLLTPTLHSFALPHCMLQLPPPLFCLGQNEEFLEYYHGSDITPASIKYASPLFSEQATAKDHHTRCYAGCCCCALLAQTRSLAAHMIPKIRFDCVLSTVGLCAVYWNTTA
jgi:hypothetical protein